MVSNSAKTLREHGVNPVRNTYCGLLSGLRVFSEDVSDLVEYAALARGRKRGDVAHAPHPVDDVVVSAVLDVEERALGPRRPVRVARAGQMTLAAALGGRGVGGAGGVGRAVSIRIIAPRRVSLDPIHDRPDLVDPFDAAVPGIPDQREVATGADDPGDLRHRPSGIEPVERLSD